MKSIKVFFTNNLRQFKMAFLATSLIFALFIAALLIFGSTKYSLFDTLTLPLGLAVFLGLIVTLIVILIGSINWLYKEDKLNKYLKVFIENYQFDIRPRPKTIWELKMPALYGNLNSQDIIIEVLEKKDLFITFADENTPLSNRYGFIYKYKELKKLGAEHLLKELTLMITPVEGSKKNEHK